MKNDYGPLSFLNVIWFNRLKEILSDNNLLDETTNNFIENAINENRKYLAELKENYEKV